MKSENYFKLTEKKLKMLKRNYENSFVEKILKK